MRRNCDPDDFLNSRKCWGNAARRYLVAQKRWDDFRHVLAIDPAIVTADPLMKSLRVMFAIVAS